MDKNTLPPYRKTVLLKFSSLRMALGANYGVMFDVDTIVEREAYRVKTKNGTDWKWQVKCLNMLSKYDPTAETDQEVFDTEGSALEFEIKPVSRHTNNK